MPGFDDREKAFEDKYKHDQNLQFRVEVRRNKLLGLWAAELLNMSGEAAEAYAKQVVAADFDEPGDADLVRKLLDDFKDKGVELSERQLRKRMEELLVTAKAQVMSE